MTVLFPDARAASARLFVDLGAIRDNYRELARRAAAPLIPMVKADGYGLGAGEVVHALAPERPLAWGVATVAEAAALRARGVTGRIIAFTPALPQDFASARSAGVELVLESPAAIAEWSGARGAWHLQVDTGMSRAGIRWDDATAIGAALAAGDAPASVFTHFHSADVPDDTMAGQLARFTQVLAGFDERPACVHVANSAAILRGVPGGPWDAARPGIALYGVSTWPGSDWTPAPVATLTAPIVALRDIPAGESVSYLATWRAASTRRIATVACGYADGLPRTAGNTHVARVHDASVPIVGVVTMDMAMLDVTDVPCEVGDEATIIGWGGATVADLARATGRSPYELLTGLRPRGVRVSVDTGPARAPRLAGASA